MMPWKPEKVKELKELINSHSVVGLLDLTSLPSNKIQEIKKKLRGKAIIKMTKKNLILRAIEGSKYPVLKDSVKGQAAVLVSDISPFELYSAIEELSSNAPAKPGMTAPFDLIVHQGGTGIPLGPAIGELQQAGLPAKIEGGQVVISKETVLVKKGEVVTPQKAAALLKLGVEPIRVQLNVVAMLEKGIIYTPDVLHVDINELKGKFTTAASWAFNLAVEAAWESDDTILALVQKAARQGKALAKEAGIDAPQGETKS